MRRNGNSIRTAAIGLTLALLCGMLPADGFLVQAAEAQETDTESRQTEQSAQTEESEEEAAPERIGIRTAEDFLDFARQCCLDAWSVNKWVVLEQDIDLTGTDFEMIPVFSGTFDGGGHTVSGFYSVGDGYVGGLFRYIEQDATVKNLNLEGTVTGTGEKECIGGICGYNYGTIRNCNFTGTLNGKDTVGGIAGTNGSTGLIINCSIRGHVAGYYMTGGIAGANHGTLSQCRNYCGINDDSRWVEEDDEMGTDILSGIRSSNQDLELYSGVDTGGIVGYSDGTVTGCTNYGTVGYEHTGYNIGGIAGRQAGVVNFCQNMGQVYGRKDVGGIVGQMEPYIEVNEADSLRNAVNKLHDLIDKTLDDMQGGKDVVKTDIDNLTAYGDDVLRTGNSMADQLTNFMDTNVAQIREINARMDYVVSQLPAVTDDIAAAGTAFDNFSSQMKEAVGDLGSVSGGNRIMNINAVDPEAAGSQTVSLESLQENIGQLNQTANEISGTISSGNGLPREWSELSGSEQELLMTETASLSQKAQSAQQQTAIMLTSMSRRIASSGTPGEEMQAAMDYLQSAANSLKSAADRSKSILDYLNSQPDIRFVALGEDFNKDRQALYVQLQGISNSLKSLSGNLSDCSDTVNEDLKAVNDQLNVVFNLMADHLSGGTGLSVEEMYEEVSDEEIDTIDTGRTDSCSNQGVVKGDINIGGIAGSMAIDEEDPEDNAAGSIDYEIGRRFIMKCIIQNCKNHGYVTAKKDGVGGITGYMAHGIVIDSESYGSVESTEGDYAGGICGQSLTVIRRCYALCNVSGGKNVGGIAGYANTMKDCYAMVDVQASAGRKGAVAGQTAQPEESGGEEDAEPNVCRNYYVGDSVNGIDDIGYVGVAEPISYEELLQVEGVPGEFRHLKVIYRVDDEYLGEQEVPYGAGLSDLQFPEIPQKEGYYGVWPDCSEQVMHGNLVLQGEYRENVPVVESLEKEGQTEQGEYEFPYGLIEQAFTENTRLNIEPIQSEPPQQISGTDYVIYQVSISDSGLKEGETLAVRLLNPYQDAQIWTKKDDTWIQLESVPRGRYLQVEMTGETGIFCVAKQQSYVLYIAAAIAAAGVGILIVVLIGKRLAKKKKIKEKNHS